MKQAVEKNSLRSNPFLCYARLAVNQLDHTLSEEGGEIFQGKWAFPRKQSTVSKIALSENLPTALISRYLFKVHPPTFAANDSLQLSSVFYS